MPTQKPPQTKTYTVAVSLTECGFSVIPTRPGSKRPQLDSWAEYQHRIADGALLPDWFANGNGIAVIGGSVSGNLEILDFDQPGLWGEYETACNDNGVSIPEGAVLMQTPSGGNHLYYRCTEAVGGNRKLATDAERKVLIETRGEGGYALTFPSEGYKILRGRPKTVPTVTAEQREALHAIAGLFNAERHVEVEERGEGIAPIDRAGSPGSDYNIRGDYLAVMEKHGFRRLHRRGELVTWVRPGKTENELSATTGYAGIRMLYVFSTNCPPFEERRKYSPFAVYTLLEHGGDFTDSTRALGKEGFGSPPINPNTKKKTVPPSPPTINAHGDEEDGEPEEPDPDMSEFQLASLWARSVEAEFCYVEGAQWWRYEENHWQYSSEESATRSVQEFLTRTGKVTPARVRNVRFLAQSMLGPHKVSSFNAHPSWIPLRNGVYDTEANELLPHDPMHLLSYQLPYDYAPDADCPTWKRCLQEWLITESGEVCPEWITLVQDWFGYCLIPDNTAQMSMFWLGEGGNGKGVTTRALEGLVGANSCTSIPIEQLHDPYHRADIHGKLVGFVNEPDRKAMQKNGNWFKLLTGGEDPISARRPTEKVFNFKSVCRVTVTCNDLPATNDPSRAYFRRIVPIDWRYNVPEEKKDTDLDKKVRAERAGIFNWAIEGLNRWKARGRKFEIPAESKKMLEGYRNEQDIMGRFFAEECSFDDPFDFVPSKDLYKAYKTWCENNGSRVETDTAIGRRMGRVKCYSERRSVKNKHTERSEQVRCWIGVQLITVIEEKKREEERKANLA